MHVRQRPEIVQELERCKRVEYIKSVTAVTDRQSTLGRDLRVLWWQSLVGG